MAELIIVGALLLGVLISLIEIFFVHEDEAGLGWMKHAAHAVPFTILFTFIAMNIDWALMAAFQMDVTTYGTYAVVGFRAAIGLVAAFVVKAKAALIKGSGGGLGEKLPHALVIGALIAASPYIWAFVTPKLTFLPAWALK